MTFLLTFSLRKIKFKPFLDSFLLILNVKTNLVTFCKLKQIKFLLPKCTSLLLHTKVVLPYYLLAYTLNVTKTKLTTRKAFVTDIFALEGKKKSALLEKCPNTEVFLVRIFPHSEWNMERYGVSLRMQSECGKIWTRKSSVFGHFPRSAEYVKRPLLSGSALHLDLSYNLYSLKDPVICFFQTISFSAVS